MMCYTSSPVPCRVARAVWLVGEVLSQGNGVVYMSTGVLNKV